MVVVVVVVVVLVVVIIVVAPPVLLLLLLLLCECHFMTLISRQSFLFFSPNLIFMNSKLKSRTENERNM